MNICSLIDFNAFGENQCNNINSTENKEKMERVPSVPNVCLVVYIYTYIVNVFSSISVHPHHMSTDLKVLCSCLHPDYVSGWRGKMAFQNCASTDWNSLQSLISMYLFIYLIGTLHVNEQT